MSRKLIWLALLASLCLRATGQVYSTRTGFAGFYSKTPLEDIRAEDQQVYAIIDAGAKNIAIAALLKGFVFTKELMQVHFNENYVESDKYPKTTFNGSYTGDVHLDKDGIYPITVRGNLSLHNVTRQVEEPATLEVRNGRLVGKSEFSLKPEDFQIQIPSIVRDKIASEIKVRIQIDCSTSK